MTLFGFLKKKEEKETTCCCSQNCNSKSTEQVKKAKQEGRGIKVLGAGCAKCNELEMATKAALSELGMSTEIDHVTDFAQIASYGVMSTPALVVDGKVVSCGKVLSKEQAKDLLQIARG